MCIVCIGKLTEVAFSVSSNANVKLPSAFKRVGKIYKQKSLPGMLKQTALYFAC